MKIALLGYGKMGKMIEQIAKQNGHEIVAKIDCGEDLQTFQNQLITADVAIEFSMPQTVVKNIYHCFDLSLPIVVGTTGWNAHQQEIFAYAKQHQKTLFYASNFSIGVNLFFELNKKLAKMMKNYDDYSVSLEEVHHLQKLDKPSGTAISLANDIAFPTENIISMREAEVVGIHSVFYDSDEDFIEIKHEAKSRVGFAKGAVTAAEWVVGKVGVYTMSDLMGIHASEI